MTKVKVFRHNDLDGKGVSIVTQAIFGVDNVSDVPCANDEVDKKIMAFLDAGEYVDYDMIIVGDISFSEEVAEKIMSHANLKRRFLLVDHHVTALGLNKYPFSCVEVERNGYKASGTSSLLDILLCNNGYLVQPEYNKNALKHFAEKVRRYDTWEWSTIYKDIEANMLNQLFYLVGEEDFGASILDKISNDKIHKFFNGEWNNLFTQSERELLKVESARKEDYIDKKIKKVKYGVYNQPEGYYIYAYVFAEQYISDLGNNICVRLDVDFAMIIDIQGNKVSLRSRGERCDVSKIAKTLGGGGHKNASGFYKAMHLGVSELFIPDVETKYELTGKNASFIEIAKAKVKKLIDSIKK